MKISNSKKKLAEIIHANGGWRDGMSFSWYGHKTKKGYFGELRPRFDSVPGSMVAYGDLGVNVVSFECTKLPNWRQTILSRDEYFHLYPAPDADGWIEWKGGAANPVEFGVLVDVKLANGEVLNRVPANSGAEWRHCWGDTNIIAYRLHKPEQVKSTAVGDDKTNLAAKEELEAMGYRESPEQRAKLAKIYAPTIEQLATDYRNAKDYADRKQQEADAAKADAEAKLAELVAAGKALGLVLSVAGPEPELVITDWRDFRVGDEVECIESNINRYKYHGMVGRLHLIDESDASTPYLVDFGDVKIWCHKVKFIRRPAKGGADV